MLRDILVVCPPIKFFTSLHHVTRVFSSPAFGVYLEYCLQWRHHFTRHDTRDLRRFCDDCSARPINVTCWTPLSNTGMATGCFSILGGSHLFGELDKRLPKSQVCIVRVATFKVKMVVHNLYFTFCAILLGGKSSSRWFAHFFSLHCL